MMPRFSFPRLAAILRPIATFGVLLVAWEAAVRLLDVPAFLLPPPSRIAATIAAQPGVLIGEARWTLAAMLGGLAIGVVLGIVTALAMILSATVRRFGWPLVIASQALPVFALAPLLVIWLGFGLASKIAMVALVTYFPVALAFFEGMKRADPGLLDLVALERGSRAAEVRHVRAPGAVPALMSGLRGAVVAAPMGAIIGEWVGSAAGLGFLMIQANARMQTDVVFAAVVVLALIAAGLWAIVDALARRAAPWAAESVAGG